MNLLETLQGILNHLGLHTNVAQFIVLFGLAMSRLVTAISLSPFLGGGAVSARIKTGLAVIITLVLFPSIAANVDNQQITTLVFAGLLVKEAMIGATIGFVSQLIFYAVQVAGTVIDTQRGMNQATFFAPQLAGNVSVLGQLKFQAALVLFLVLDGHLAFLRALHASFQNVSLVAYPHFQSGTMALIEEMARQTANVFVIALQLSAPVLLALFLVDVAFAAIAKVASQINVHYESQTVKSLVGLAVFFLTAAFVMQRLQGFFPQMIKELYNISKMLV